MKKDIKGKSTKKEAPPKPTYINRSLHKKIPLNIIPIKHKPQKEIKIVAISDNHGDYLKMNQILSMTGDIFIHAGDFTFCGRQEDFVKFFDFLDKLKFKHKIVISGNHEIILDNGCMHKVKKEKFLSKYKCSMSKEEVVRELKKRCIYLQHQMVEVQNLKVFGSPYSNQWAENAFQYKDENQAIIWNSIPNNIDILITHSPPYQILDEALKFNGGSYVLREVCLNRKPKYHIFGHIHESAGYREFEGIKFLNVSNLPTQITL